MEQRDAGDDRGSGPSRSSRCACRSCSTSAPTRSSAPTSPRTRTTTGSSTTATSCWPATVIVTQFLASVRGVPAAAEGGELHDRPGGREARGGARRRVTETCDGQQLPSWNDTDARRRSSSSSRVREPHGFVAAEERVAVFDNDGTLWCEKPMPIEVDFILRAARRDGGGRRVAARRSSRGRPRTSATTAGSAAHRRSTTPATTPTCEAPGGGVIAAFAGITVDDFEAQADAFLRTGRHPTSRPGLLRVRLRADGRAACATWRRTGSRTTSPRAAAATSCARSATRCTASRPTASSAARTRSTTRGRRRAARSSASRSPTSSTTARRSPSGSGAASAGDRSSPSATRTATFRCSLRAAADGRPPPARRPRRRRARVRLHDRRRGVPRARGGGGLDGGQRQERLGDSVHNLIGDAIAGFSA